MIGEQRRISGGEELCRGKGKAAYAAQKDSAAYQRVSEKFGARQVIAQHRQQDASPPCGRQCLLVHDQLV